MRKCCFLLFVLAMFTQADASLVWNESEITMGIGESKTVQICNTDDGFDQYLYFYTAHITPYSASNISITNVTPLECAGDLATATPTPGDPSQWTLSSGWSGYLPLIDWTIGPHWNVTIQGLAPTCGVVILDHGYSCLQVDVTPEPATIALLGLGALAMLRRKYSH